MSYKAEGVFSFLNKIRKYILIIFDIVIWSVSYYFSFAIIKNSFSLHNLEGQFLKSFILYNISYLAVFLILKMYDKIWRYADIIEFFYIGLASVIANAAFFILTMLINMNLGIRVYVVATLMTTFLLFIFRFIYKVNRMLDNKYNGISKPVGNKRLMIVGGGEACVAILRELKRNPKNQFLPVCIVDDDEAKLKRSVAGVTVAGTTSEIGEICDKYKIDAILFAIANISVSKKRKILSDCAKTGREVNIVPDIYNTIVGEKEASFENIRKINVEDLLGRESISLNVKAASKYITGARVLVTGGGGSIGSELCRQIAKYSPSSLVILDIYENSAYDIQQELKMQYGDSLEVHTRIASIRDTDKMDFLFNAYRPNIVFHAAAHKHVPLMETSPEEAIKNNVFGTLNIVKMCDKYGAKRFIQISTDKAVNPTNVMGTTKRICEMIIQCYNEISKTEYVAVRFGNVLGSNGSVIPLFEKQIQNGGPVTVTHPDIIRYFMTIPEAVSLVLTAGSMAKGGEIFVLDMGEPVKINDLAENIIRLKGYVPNKDIKIVYTGLRPGEKLYEELLMSEEGMTTTPNKKIFIGKPIEISSNEFFKSLDELYLCTETNDKDKIRRKLKEIVPTYCFKEDTL